MTKANDILFGKFEVQQHVGGGTFGEVYQVKEIGTDAVLAVKLLHGKHDDTDLAEAALLRQLDHANIVKFYGYETTAEHLGFVMEYMDGGSLADLCELEGSVSPEKATSLMIQVCKGMEFAHSKNVIHRDLKPENILLNTDGRVKVADFGVAKALAEKSAASTTIGTPYYMAPEQFDGKYGISVDVYALGCIFYHLLKGAPPFTGTHGEVVKGHLMKAPQIPAHWPQPVSELLKTCLAKDPDKRPADAGQLLEQIKLLAKLDEDPDATHMVKRSATMFAQKKVSPSDFAKLVKQPEAGHSAGRSNDEQAQTLANKAEAFMDRGDFARARKYLELAKEADSDYVAYAERTDRLEVQEKSWPHKQEAETALKKGDLPKAQSALETVKELAGEDDIWLGQFREKLSEILEKQRREEAENQEKLSQEKEAQERREAAKREKLQQEKAERARREAEEREKQQVETKERARKRKPVKSQGVTWRVFLLLLILLAVISSGVFYLLLSGDQETEPPIEEKATDSRKTATSNPSSGMVPIPGGSFMMGCVPGDSGCGDDEKPRHRVTVDSFYMDMYEVTQSQYEKVMGKNPSHFKNCGGNCPVESVTWNDAKTYCQKSGKRLPTEAEWEYAARGGKDGEKFYSDVDRIAWYSSNSGSKTHPVGQKQANGYGLYDMSGNVWEWCSDWYGEDYYSSSPANNPAGPSSGKFRVLRGGGWNGYTRGLCASYRGRSAPTSGYYSGGFRCVGD